MLKKHIKAFALCALLSLGTAVYAAPQYPDETAEPVEQVLPDGQVALKSDAPDSKPVNYIEESETARKMAQLEKARNVEENDSWGGAVTIIAMVIVISALIILCLLFMGFGKISQMLMASRKRDAHGIEEGFEPDHHEDIDSGEAIAAIAAALAEHFGQNHDLEDTILTIRRMKRAYSPWNSKIHGLRHLPELHRNNH